MQCGIIIISHVHGFLNFTAKGVYQNEFLFRNPGA